MQTPVCPRTLLAPIPQLQNALGIFVLLSLQPATARPRFCAFALLLPFFPFFFLLASFTKTPILPPRPRDLPSTRQKKGRAARERKLTQNVVCGSLCPLCNSLHNELPWPPTSPRVHPGAPSAVLPDGAAGRVGDAPCRVAESTLFVLGRGAVRAGWRSPCSCSSKKPPCIPTGP